MAIIVTKCRSSNAKQGGNRELKRLTQFLALSGLTPTLVTPCSGFVTKIPDLDTKSF